MKAIFLAAAMMLVAVPASAQEQMVCDQQIGMGGTVSHRTYMATPIFPWAGGGLHSHYVMGRCESHGHYPVWNLSVALDQPETCAECLERTDGNLWACRHKCRGEEDECVVVD